MNIYILKNEVHTPEDDEKYFNILGAFKRKYEAINAQNEYIKDKVENSEFVENESGQILEDETIIFFKNQKNWENYISYSIQKVEMAV